MCCSLNQLYKLDAVFIITIFLMLTLVYKNGHQCMIILFQDEPHRAYAFFGTEYYDAVNTRIRLVEEVRMGEERNAYDELFLYREV